MYMYLKTFHRRIFFLSLHSFQFETMKEKPKFQRKEDFGLCSIHAFHNLNQHEIISFITTKRRRKKNNMNDWIWNYVQNFYLFHLTIYLWPMASFMLLRNLIINYHLINSGLFFPLQYLFWIFFFQIENDEGHPQRSKAELLFFLLDNSLA